MRTFEFIILFLSFVYALALTHLLLSATQMIRNRKRIVFSLPHAIWMSDALLILLANWVSLWDFHAIATISLWAIVIGFALTTIQYFICALVSPDFSDERDFDLRAFNDRQSSSYLYAFLALVLLALASNATAGLVGIQKWASENAIVLVMLPAVAVPLVVRKVAVQVAGGLLLGAACIAYLCIYYPVIR